MTSERQPSSNALPAKHLHFRNQTLHYDLLVLPLYLHYLPLCESSSGNFGVLRALGGNCGGVTGGLGRESAVRLAKAGATVVLTTRTEAKGKKAVEEVMLGSRAGVRSAAGVVLVVLVVMMVVVPCGGRNGDMASMAS